MRNDGAEAGAIVAAIRNPSINRKWASQSNGSLMRILPLAIWGARLPVARLAEFAKQESALTHPTEPCTDVVALYTIAVAHLIAHTGDPQGALDAASSWAASNACEEVQRWLHEALGTAEAPVDCLSSIEWLRWPFQQAFMHLSLGSSYEAGLRQVLAAGGEPCTNACIVCGMLGALHGAGAVPQSLSGDVMGCRVGSRGIERPEYMQTGAIPSLVKGLVQRALSDAEV